MARALPRIPLLALLVLALLVGAPAPGSASAAEAHPACDGRHRSSERDLGSERTASTRPDTSV